MPKICYVPKRFSRSSRAIIYHTNTIISDYQDQGYNLTLRQIYYQFVSRDLIPNKQSEYKRLGSVINDGRLAGLIDWSAVEDRTRVLRMSSHWNNPKEIIDACGKQYQIDKWKNQDVRVEVWIEKDALVGVIERVCKEHDVPYFSCRGYTSQSEMWYAAMRLIGHSSKKQATVILHLGDHDPSGIDMTRDIKDRMRIFGCETFVQRIALNKDQIEEYSPPPNPAKMTDSRYHGYIMEFGEESWELDALEPSVLSSLVNDAILGLRNGAKWGVALKKEQRDRRKILRMAKEI